MILLQAKRGSHVKSFYSMNDYEKWRAENPDSVKYSIKYYKGLIAAFETFFRTLMFNYLN